jgi:hypothetical protein
MSASVSQNPFLRPGSQQKPPPVSVNKFIPKPIPQKDLSKEVEFRGYFILKGKPYFCLLNKKSNHAEWITLSEHTYEEYEAYEFDQTSEVLTVKYEGISYEISLIQGGSSSSIISPVTSQRSSQPSSVVPVTSSTFTPQAPKYMPPRPVKTPSLPSWLVNRKAPPQRSSTNTGRRSMGIIPRRISTMNNSSPSGSTVTSSFPSERLVTESRSSQPSNLTQTSSTNELGNSFSNETSSLIPDISQNPETEGDGSGELDLENLPPPPPPPNIVPPTPPPNILPSRED